MIALTNLGIAAALGIVAFNFESLSVIAGQLAIGVLAVVNSFDLISKRMEWRSGFAFVPPVLKSRMVEIVSFAIALSIAFRHALGF